MIHFERALPRAERLTIDRESIAQAAVALIVRERASSAEMLVIQRALNPNDHWSGHLALPGGRADDADESLLATAAREVLEEVGIELSLDRDFVGQLRAIAPMSERLPSINVTPFVAVAPALCELRLSFEVDAAMWISIPSLLKTGRSDFKTYTFEGTVHEFPAYPSERGPIWGITERIITDFLQYLT